ncbi:unnamed protein product, partial [Ectocarpus sp. 12 AP-2014]
MGHVTAPSIVCVVQKSAGFNSRLSTETPTTLPIENLCTRQDESHDAACSCLSTSCPTRGYSTLACLEPTRWLPPPTTSATKEKIRVSIHETSQSLTWLGLDGMSSGCAR